MDNARQDLFFISYASVDRAWATWIARQLRKANWRVELDVVWSPGADFVDRMAAALTEADKVVAIFSAAYFTHPFSRREWQAAFARNAQHEGRLVPVLVERCEIPELYATLVYIDLTDLDEQAAAQRLIGTLKGDPPDTPVVFPGAVPVQPDEPYPGGAGPSPVSAQVSTDSARSWGTVVLWLAVFAAVAGAITYSLRGSGLEWVVGPVLGLVAAAGATPDAARGLKALLDRVPSRPRARGDEGKKPRYRVLVAAAVTGTVVVVLGIPGTWWLLRPASSCPEPLQLRVLTSADGLVPTRELARSYELSNAGSGRCPKVSLYVYSAESEGTAPTVLAAALARGWKDDSQDNPLRDIGPRPDVWFPDSTMDVEEVKNIRNITDESLKFSPVDSSESIARSPIVLGFTATEAVNARPNMRWADLLRSVAGGHDDLIRPDPETSTTGRLATLAVYGSEAALYRTRSGVAGLTNQVRSLEQRIARSLDKGRQRPSANSAALLCRVRTDGSRPPGDARPPAVITSEQALIRYGQGFALSEECGTPPGARPDQECPTPHRPLPDKQLPLVVYPADTVSLDHPFVRFTWTTSQQSKDAVADFRRWFDGAEGKAALLCAGLRPADSPARASWLRDRKGPLPATPPPQVLQPTWPGMTAALQRYHSVLTPGRVLLALDTSGSMSEPVAGTAATRFQVAVRGVRGSLNQMGPLDQFGLWTFPDKGKVEIGTGEPVRREVATALKTVPKPAGGTPLYKTIIDATAKVGPGTQHRQAVVVLTDGEDTTSHLRPRDVEQAISGKGVKVYIVAAGEAHCGDRPLADITTAVCYQATFDNIDDRLAELFGTLWGGQ